MGQLIGIATILSTLFMAAGVAAVAWLAWSLIRQVRARGRNRTATPAP